MIYQRKIFWILGVLVAFTGVALVRVLPAQVPQYNNPLIIVCGYMISILGLFIITLGTRRKNPE